MLFGLAMGSFLNVCIARLPRHQSIISPASHCPACGAAIRPSDNVPLLSWLLLRGRCRSCAWRIPPRYPLVELSSMFLFLLCGLLWGVSVKSAGMCLLCFLLLGLAVMDAETLLLPDAFTLPGIVLGVLYSGIVAGWHAAVWSFVDAIIAGLALLLLRWLYWMLRRSEGLGLGDVKLLAMIAAWLGPPQTLLVLFLGTVCTAVFGLALLPFAGKHLAQTKRPRRESVHSEGGPDASRAASPWRATALPYGSFLCASAIYAIFMGPQTIRWYLHFFFK